ncbi:LppA family lipoprotein [Haloechinothrix aidingensis]|nr:LppA family lipoprotein [Haloechinothrix aidingensis]
MLAVRRRALRLLAVLAAVVVVGCGDASDYIGGPGEREDRDELSVAEQFDELAQRPDIEQATERYEEMLSEISTELRGLTDLPEWQRLEGMGSQPGCNAFPDVGNWDAERRFMDDWFSPGHIAEEEWPVVRDALHRIAGEYGFDTVVQDIFQADARSYKLVDGYGAQLSFGYRDNTTLDVMTGCHLLPEALEHGGPRPRPTEMTPR